MMNKMIKTSLAVALMAIPTLVSANALQDTGRSTYAQLVYDEQWYPLNGTTELDFEQFTLLIKQNVGSKIQGKATIIYSPGNKDNAKKVAKILSSLGVSAPSISFEEKRGARPVSVVIRFIEKSTTNCEYSRFELHKMAEGSYVQDEKPCWIQSNYNLQAR